MAKVTLLVKTLGAKKGDVIDVDPKIADYLVANHNAAHVKPAKSSKD